jgi:hypothetical protein
VGRLGAKVEIPVECELAERIGNLSLLSGLRDEL